jgi:hypothetical protein
LPGGSCDLTHLLCVQWRRVVSMTVSVGPRRSRCCWRPKSTPNPPLWLQGTSACCAVGAAHSASRDCARANLSDVPLAHGDIDPKPSHGSALPSVQPGAHRPCEFAPAVPQSRGTKSPPSRGPQGTAFGGTPLHLFGNTSPKAHVPGPSQDRGSPLRSTQWGRDQNKQATPSCRRRPQFLAPSAPSL